MSLLDPVPLSRSYDLGSKTGGADILAADLSHSNKSGRVGLLLIALATAGIVSIVYNNGESDEQVVKVNNGSTLTGGGLFYFALPASKTLNFQTSVTGDVDLLEVYELSAGT